MIASRSIAYWCAIPLLLIAACNARTPERQTTTGSDSLNGTVSAAPGEEPRSVVVTLKEFEIRMPTVLKPGAYLLKVTNAGSAPHSLAITGPTTEIKLPTDLQPGETQTLPIDLAPGTYRVFCPVGGHADRGMAMQLTVEG